MAGGREWAVGRVRRSRKDLHHPQERVVWKRKIRSPGGCRRRSQLKDRARRVSGARRREWVRQDDFEQTVAARRIARFRIDQLQRPWQAHRRALSGWRGPETI